MSEILMNLLQTAFLQPALDALLLRRGGAQEKREMG